MVRKLYRYFPGFKRVKRSWRSRGFGIHSPFAFRFVTCVLRERGEYYAYREMREFIGNSGRFKSMSLIVRLVCEFRPAIVAISGDANVDILSRSVRLADSRADIVKASDFKTDDFDVATAQNEPSLLYVITDHSADEQTAARISSRADAIVCLGQGMELFGRLKANQPVGMSFKSRRAAVIVNRRDLPRQDFEVNF